jgi:hypothetical protein
MNVQTTIATGGVRRTLDGEKVAPRSRKSIVVEAGKKVNVPPWEAGRVVA